MRSRLVPLLLLTSGVLAPGRLARAETESQTQTETARQTPVERCMMMGDKLLDQARGERDATKRSDAAIAVRKLCEVAQKSEPLNPKPLLMLARSHLISDPARPEQCLPGECEAALQLLAEARRLDRTLEHAPRIAFDTAMVYSRMSRFADAIAEYDRAMRYVGEVRQWHAWFDAFDDSMLWGNSAESLMALGRLEEAVERYRRAVATANPRSLGWALGLWGLGVALDRDGQVELSRRAIQQVLKVDPAMGRLAADGVFFEPPGDAWYYTALGHEVSGDLYRAAEHFRNFIHDAPNSQYIPAARRHLAALERERLVKGPTGVVTIASRSGAPSAWVEGVVAQFQRHKAELQLCYDRALQKNPKVRGLAHFIVTYGETGPEIDMQPRPSEMIIPFAQCAALQMDGWRFDYQGGSRPEAQIVLELGGKL